MNTTVCNGVPVVTDFDGAEARTTVGRPTNLNSYDREFWQLMPGYIPSVTGVAVTPETAVGYAPFWRALNLISNTIAKLPLYVYKRLERNARDVDPSHPAYNLLRWEANRYMSAFTLMQVMIGHKIFRGNGYAFIDRDAAANPIEILPLNPENVTPFRKNGVLDYILYVDSDHVALRPDQVLHFIGFGYDGLCGYDFLTYQKNTLGMGIAARDFAGRFFANDQRPGMVLKFPHSLSEAAAQRLAGGINALKPGIEHRHKLAILEEGGELQMISQTAKDSQLDELSRLSIVQVSNATGVPPHKLGDTSRQGYNSLEQENQSFADGLDEHMVPIEQECRRKLLTEEQKRTDSHFFSFERKALVRADIVARNTALQIQRRNGIINGNQWCNVEDLPPISTESGGDTYIVESNMQPMSALTVQQDDEPPQELDVETDERNVIKLPHVEVAENATVPESDSFAGRSLEAHRAAAGEAARLVMRRIGKDAARKAKAGGAAFMAWIEDGIVTDHRAVVLEAFGGAMRSLRSLRSNAGDSLAEDLTAALLAGSYDAFIEATSVQPAELTASVTRAAAAMEQAGTEWLTRKVNVTVPSAISASTE